MFAFGKTLLPLLATLLVAAHASAEVKVDTPWVRATVASQTATGAFLDIQSDTDAQVIGASSPVAGTVEIHVMSMTNDVMDMHQVKQVALPAHTRVRFSPDTFHIMLLNLKQPITEGSQVPITLLIQDATGKQHSVDFLAPVRALDAE